MPPSPTTDPQRMTMTRIFNAPRELVWEAWTNPQYAKQWWGPQGFTAPVCTIDFRVGGAFRFCMRSPEGQEFWTGGQYHEIVPHEKIVFSLYPTDPEGNRVDPAQYGITSEVIEGAHDLVLFEQLEDGRTKVTMIGNETMESAQESGQVEGWNQILDKFAAVVADLQETKNAS